MFAPVPRTTGTALSRNLEIPISRGNPSSYVQVVGNENIPLVLHDWKPWLDLDPDGYGLVLETLE